MTDERRTYLLSLAAMALLGLTAFSWFEGSHSAVAGYDFATSLNPLDELKRSLYLWDERLYAGAPNILGIGTMPYFLLQYLLERLTGSLYRGEMVFFAILFMLPGFTMYHFLRTMNRGAGRGEVSFYGALFYMFNTFVVVKWNRGELITLFSYGSLPLFLTLAERGLKGPLNMRFIVIFMVSLFFFPVTLGHSADFLIVTGIIVVFSLWRVFSSFGYAVVKRGLALLVIAAIASAWWALPVMSSVAGGSAGITSFTTNELEMVNYYSRWASLLNITKLWFSPMYDTSVEFGTQFYRPGTLLFPLIAFTALFYRRNGAVLFFSALALTGLWLSKGTSAPFPGAYGWMYRHIPYFFIFRAPSRYFPLVYTLSLSVLIGYSTAFITASVRGLLSKRSAVARLPGVLVVGLIFFHSWPLFSRSTIFRTVQGDLLYPSVFIDIPPYYGELNRWFRSRDGYFRVHSFVTESYLNYDWGYSSTDIMPKLLEVPQTLRFRQELVFGSSGFHELMDSVEKDFWDWDFGDTAKTLGLLSVGYITVVDDVMRRYLPDSNYYEILRAVLESEPGLKVRARAGKATVYENAYKLPHIFAVPEANFVVGGPSALTALSQTGHLDRPALLFIDRLDKKTISAPDGSTGPLILADSAPRDIVCENLKDDYRVTVSGQSSFFAAEDADYLVWAKLKKGVYKRGPVIDVFVDGTPVTGGEQAGIRWVNVGEVRVKAGGHNLSVTTEGVEGLLALPAKVWEEELERTSGLLSDPAIPKEAIFRINAGGSLSFDSSVESSVVVTTLRAVKREKIAGVREDYTKDPDRGRWAAFGPAEISFDGGVPMNAGKESRRVGKTLKGGGFDLEEYPYAELYWEGGKGGNYDIDLIIGVDTDGDGWAESVLTVPMVKDGEKTAAVSLSEMLKKKFGFPGKPRYKGLWVAFELKESALTGEGAKAFCKIKGLEFYQAVPAFVDNSGSSGLPGVRLDGSRIKGTRRLKNGPHELKTDGRARGAGGYLLRVAGKGREKKSAEVPVLDWKKIDPARYEVSVRGARRPFWLIFNESYNRGWKAYIKRPYGKGIKEASMLAPLTGRYWKKEIEEHRTVNGFANGWWVAGDPADFEIVIEFRPQSSLNSGALISGSACAVLLVGLPFYFLRGRKKPAA